MVRVSVSETESARIISDPLSTRGYDQIDWLFLFSPFDLSCLPSSSLFILIDHGAEQQHFRAIYPVAPRAPRVPR